jgi:hypothetical protein
LADHFDVDPLEKGPALVRKVSSRRGSTGRTHELNLHLLDQRLSGESNFIILPPKGSDCSHMIIEEEQNEDDNEINVVQQHK